VVNEMTEEKSTVVSLDEMKRRMKMKKQEAEEKDKMEEVKEKASEQKEEIKEKAGEVKEGVSEQKEDVSEKIEEVKEEASEKKEKLEEKVGEVKEEAAEQKEDVSEKIEEVKEEAAEQKEKVEKESKAEGMTPAEKLLNDLVSRLKGGAGQIDEALSEYTKESTTKESKAPKTATKPLIDVLETNDTIIVIADISGVNKDDINIGISKNSVEITAMYKDEPEIEDAKFTQKERSYGKTHRKILLSTEIKVKEAKAKFKDCTLTITLPKTVEDITKINID
jgi:HSP20 family protein